MQTGSAYSRANSTTFVSENTVMRIPYTSFRVLDLRDAYWTGASAPMHRSCYD